MRTRDEDYDYLYKIVLVGEAAVGKTHLLSRYIKGQVVACTTNQISFAEYSGFDECPKSR